jgi:hypothetical protein
MKVIRCHGCVQKISGDDNWELRFSEDIFLIVIGNGSCVFRIAQKKKWFPLKRSIATKYKKNLKIKGEDHSHTLF